MPPQARPEEKDDGVPFRDPHVEKALGIKQGEILQAGAGLHSGGDGANFRIVLGQAAEALSKGGGKRGCGFRRLAGFHVELAHAVIPIRALRCKGIALSLNCLHMQQDRTVDFFAVSMARVKSFKSCPSMGPR